MQTHTVRKINWLASISIVLEIWGLLTSFLFLTLFVQPGYVFSLGGAVQELMLKYYSLFEGTSMMPMAVSSILGLVGIFLSSLVLNWQGRKSRLAVAGILFGILVILCGFPSTLLLIWIYGA